MERTSIPDVEQHGHKDVVHQVQSDAVGKQGVPHHQQVLERELTTKQQAHPPADGHKDGEGECICAQGEEKVQTYWAKGVATDMP